ncbi:MAG: beta-glycosidase [Bacteroidaceae bacterium]|nr:beta-glycosidase [Bacteroidaceae bacterium]
MKKFFLLCLAVLGFVACTPDEERIDLSGVWQFALDREGLVKPGDAMSDTIVLPGTTDTNRKGDPIEWKGETTHLSRPYSYKGRAWYRRTVTIPEKWAGEHVYLTLERTKPSEVYVDGVLVGSANNISTPQRFDLTAALTPGVHELAIMVDNGSGVPGQVYDSSHAYTENTQTNWNGIIGDITLTTSLPEKKELPVHPAFKDFHIEGQQFFANGHPIYLRGRHDACVWPLTGHVAMDVDSWRHYFKVCEEYGLNHVRFHSWCPPEAAFVAADEYGIYLQPELPFWGDFNPKDTVLMDFLMAEGEAIMREYAHHPSFRMFALGNELRGSIPKMTEFIEHFRAMAPDKIYTLSSNYYLGYQGVKPGMDFFVTCRVGGEGWGNYGTHTRGSFSFADAADGGMINHFYPNTRMNFEEGCSLTDVPIISHETAQFQTYPNYDEIAKYTGALYPYNMEIFRDRLEKAGMADQAKAFHQASGQWSLRLYKQDIEMDLRTPNMAGFQLLDLQDYPGQGSAYVGILDAFLDTKGMCTAEEWRGFCAPVVPLLIADKFCYTNEEVLHADIQIANYGEESLKGKTVTWNLGEKSGAIVVATDEFGLIDAGVLDIPLADYQQATQLELTLQVEGKKECNTYDIWVYPAKNELETLKEKALITRTLTADVARRLENGESVLLMPDASEQTVGGLFQTDYWNYRMFKTISENNNRHVSPGTLGILTDPAHPLFASFPTEMHTNWQWFPVVKASHPFKLDNTAADYRPIVQVIDNIERNHKLGLVFEFAVGKGKLLVVMSDLEKASEHPEGEQFYLSVLRYMTSQHFAPKTAITVADFHRLMTTPVVAGEIGKLNNISPYKAEDYK